MELSPRRHVPIILPSHPLTPQPRARVRRVTVAPRGYDPVDALVGTPENPQGLTLHFVGFNTNIGPWEATKCAVWASITQTVVVMCELPGFSRYGHQLPTRIRHDLLEGDPSSWASATLACLKEAAGQAGIPAPEEIGVLAYSTGCSLAAAALPAIQAGYGVSSLTLVEPVSLSNRTLGRLTIHNITDLVRLLKTVPRNYPSSWVRQASLRQLREPSLRFSFPDFLALITMLAGDDTRQRLDVLDLPVTNLARGAQSKLCVESEFIRLDARLAARDIPGTTCTIADLGHQCWHCLPAVDALARAVHTLADQG